MRSASRILFLTVFIDLLGFGIVVPILAFCAKEYGASGMTLGLILGSFSLMQFLFSTVWGRLSDRVGRRPVLMASLFGNVLGFVTFALAANVVMLFASRILCGIAAASIATAQAYIADSTDEANRSRGMAIIGSAFGLGLVLGPPAGGILSGVSTKLHLAPNFVPGVAAALLSATALALAAVALPESSPRKASTRTTLASLLDAESWSLFFRIRDLRLAGGALAVLMSMLASIAPLLVLIGRDRYALNASQLGYLFGLMGIVVVALQATAVARVTRRIGDVATGMIGAACLLIGFLVVPWNLIAAAGLMGVGQGLCNPTLSSYISKVAPVPQRGGILGVASSLNALARVIGPAAAGLAYDAWSATGALLMSAGVVLAAMLLAARLLPTPRPSAPAAASHSDTAPPLLRSDESDPSG